MRQLAAPRRARRFPRVGFLLSLLLAAGCGTSTGPTEGYPAGPAKTSARDKRPDLKRKLTDYPLRGVVRQVEKELLHVRIAHEAIPGFMAAMVMRFAYSDRDFLGRLKPGDHVEGKLRVETQDGAVIDYKLTDLEITQPAPLPPLVLDAAKAELRPAERPRQLEAGDPVPDFTMTTQDGNPLKLSELRGNVVIITFIYTGCPLPDFCPLMDRKFAELARQLAAIPSRSRQVRLVSLSFDPEHDTPDILRKHAQMRGAMPPLWTYAVASHPELAKIAAPLGLLYAPGDREIAHNLCTAVIDQHGKLASLLVGRERNNWSASDLQKTAFALLPAPQSTPK
jgi:protein SCO1/2